MERFRRERQAVGWGARAIFGEAIEPLQPVPDLAPMAAPSSAVMLEPNEGNLPPLSGGAVAREPTFLEAVLQHLPAGVLIVDAPSGRVMFHNDSVVELLGGARPGELQPGAIGTASRSLIDPALARSIGRGEFPAGKEIGFKRGDGTRGVAAVHTAPIRSASGEIIAQVALFQDLTERKVAEEGMRRLALHDPLTGLPNRALLLDRLGQALGRAKREGSMVAVFLLDLDGLKEINDTLGHPAGDQLLYGVARQVTAAIRSSDTFARLGGDEFALVQPQVRHPDDATTLAGKILATFVQPIDLGGREVKSSTSIGIALFPQDGQEPGTLLRNADLALYRAKSLGRGRLCRFEPHMDQTAATRRQLKHELQQGLQRREFVLHYQLQMELTTGEFTGVEALVRWNHPQRGLVMPDEFIPAAEANGVIRPLGAWILNQACRQARLWHERGWRLNVAVNLSAVQLRDDTLVAEIEGALKDSKLDPARLELEITEGTLMENIGQQAGGVLHALTADGVRLAIDDFGTGYSSLAYLKHLPVHTIKIDRSFVRDLGQGPRDEALVKGIVTLAQTLGKQVVGEGVENSDQLDILRRLGCDVGQGFHIARPVDAEQLDDLLAAGGCRNGDEASEARKPIRQAPTGSDAPLRVPQSASVSLRSLCAVPNALRIALKARKIVSSDQLLAAAGVLEQRVALARLTRIDLGQLTDVVRRADLHRIRGLGAVFAGMLLDLGIGDIATLAGQEPAALRERLSGHNRAKRLARRSPSPDEVTAWIDRAATLPALVTHAPS